MASSLGGPFVDSVRLPRLSLRGKTLLILCLTLFGLVGGLYLVSRNVILRSFARLEEENTQEDLNRVQSAFAQELEALDRSTTDYSAWDRTFLFVHGKNQEYLRYDLPAESLLQLGLNLVWITDSSGKVLFTEAFDRATDRAIPVPRELSDQLAAIPQLRQTKVTGKTEGILLTREGPMVIDARPILTSATRGPVAGTFLMGRLLSQTEVGHLAQSTRLPLTMRPVDDPFLPPDFQDARNSLSKRSPVLIRPPGDALLTAYQLMDDIEGRPAVIFKLELPRKIYQQGETSEISFLLWLGASGLLFGALTLYLLEKMVLSRVASLGASVAAIGASGNLSARLALRGDDELSNLGREINRMLGALEKSQGERYERETRLRLLVERMPAIVWATDSDLRFTSSLGAGLAALNLQPNQVVGMTLFDYFRVSDPDYLPIAAHRRALKGEASTFHIEWAGRSLEAHVEPLRGRDGGIAGVIGVSLDTTEHKKLEEQLRQAQKMQAVGQLAGGMAHDFNNLLMVMKGHTEILADRLGPNAPLRENVEQLEKAADRAAALTRQLLAFSRMQVLQPRVIDLNRVVSELIQMLPRLIGENIELVFQPTKNLGPVRADAGQIEQALLNLVVNARDAMPSGGRLTIETANVDLDESYGQRRVIVEPGPYIMLAVSDTGCGMDAETQSHIFEPFFTTKEPGKGTGLGLSMVYGIVKQSGGFIWVYSEPGHGATFKIYLPEVKERVEEKPVERTSSGPITGSETILLVEDEESVRDLVRNFLRDNGYTVLEAADGEQAVEVARRHRGALHLLVTDVVMPKLSGRELATRLLPNHPEMKVLYISGYTNDAVVRHGVLEGDMAFLQKPFTLKDLARKLREVLDRTREEAATPPVRHGD
jgi:PAS domain S-box-containing protein